MKELTSKIKWTAKLLGMTAVLCGFTALIGVAMFGLPLWAGAVGGVVTVGVIGSL